MTELYPILEFDGTVPAVIEPSRTVTPIDIAEHCVLCFFHEVIEKIVSGGQAKVVSQQKSEMGPLPVYEFIHNGRRVALCHPGMGAPFVAAMLEELIALGCRKFMVCGAAGVLHSNTPVGAIFVPISAVRDEGTSYHYLAPGREVAPLPEAVAAIETTLKQSGLSYELGKTWTTDAFFRETPGKVAMRQAEGCRLVEMEAAAFFAVAQFRGVALGQILMGGDDVSGTDWDRRHTVPRAERREQLFWLAVDACLRL
jgi:uridine phosphorylase